MKSISERVDKLLANQVPLQVRLGNSWVDFDGEPYELLKFHRADIRAKPEREFILGEWWIPWANAKPEKLTESSIKKYNGTRPYAQNTEPVHWKPKEGEWCWFYSKDDLGPILMQFTHSGGTPIVYCAGFAGFENCEPFIGELPTFLKD